MGSSSLITDDGGNLVQHIEYVPFGEVFVDERNSTWSTPYKFNGKELDEETGLYYYGARYYDSRTSVWLSVDPLAEKYPGMTSYNYCANNPVKYIDPDGRKYRVNTFQDKKGNWNMNISSTVHVFSDKGNAKQQTKEYNKYFKDNSNLFKGSFKSKDGIKVSISVNVNYVEGEKYSNGNIKRFKNGDTLLELKENVKRGESMGAFGIDESKRTVGDKVVMNSSSDHNYYYSAPATVLHDVLHQMGLGDRYKDDGKKCSAPPTYSTDIMGFGPHKPDDIEFKQTHFNNYGNTLFQPVESNTVSKQRVDKATIKNPLEK